RERDEEQDQRAEAVEVHRSAGSAASASRTDRSIERMSARVGAVGFAEFAPSEAPFRRSGAMSVKRISARRNRSTAISSAADRPIVAPALPERAASSTAASAG